MALLRDRDGRLLVRFGSKGETVEEITAAAKVMRKSN